MSSGILYDWLPTNYGAYYFSSSNELTTFDPCIQFFNNTDFTTMSYSLLVSSTLANLSVRILTVPIYRSTTPNVLCHLAGRGLNSIYLSERAFPIGLRLNYSSFYNRPDIPCSKFQIMSLVNYLMPISLIHQLQIRVAVTTSTTRVGTGLFGHAYFDE